MLCTIPPVHLIPIKQDLQARQLLNYYLFHGRASFSNGWWLQSWNVKMGQGAFWQSYNNFTENFSYLNLHFASFRNRSHLDWPVLYLTQCKHHFETNLIKIHSAVNFVFNTGRWRAAWNAKLQTKAPQAKHYTPVHQFWKKKSSTGIPIALLNRGTIGLKWTQPLFILAILKSLDMVLRNGGSNETGRKPGLFIFSCPIIFPHQMAFVWGRLRQWGAGRKR